MKVKGLRIPEDVAVELRVDGEANFSYHSQKGKDTVLAMTEVEKLRFAIAVTAKKAVLHHYQKEQEGDHVGK